MLSGFDRLMARRLVPVLVTVSLAGGCERASRNPGIQGHALNAVTLAQSGPEIEFSQIGDVDVDSRGRIYAGDGLGEIVVMSETASLVRRFGGMGFGPGEFEAVSAVHVLPEDSLYVYDGAALRATVYLPHSTRVAYTVRFPHTDFSFPVDVEPSREGVLLAHFRRINGDVPIAGQRRDDVIRIMNRDGSIRLDSAVVVPEPEIVEVRSDRSHGFFLLPFARQSLVRWGPGGRTYTLWTDSTRITIHGAEGESQASFSVQLPFPRLPISTRTIDSLAELNARGGGFTRRSLEEAFRGRWQTWPLVQDMLVDDQSRIWLQPFTQAPEASWLAFDTKGRQLATLHLPRSVRPRLIRGDRMYAVSTDSLDVETLVVYRLTPSSTRTAEKP